MENGKQYDIMRIIELRTTKRVLVITLSCSAVVEEKNINYMTPHNKPYRQAPTLHVLAVSYLHTPYSRLLMEELCNERKI